jgi:hypothetical protein
MNPPFDAPHLYLDALVRNVIVGNITDAIALLKLGTLANQKTGRIIRENANCLCVWGAGKEKAHGRMAFIDCDGIAIRGSDFDVELVHFGSNPHRFKATFLDYGTILTFG